MTATKQVREALCVQAHAAKDLHLKFSSIIMELPDALSAETCERMQELLSIVDNALGAGFVASDLMRREFPK